MVATTSVHKDSSTTTPAACRIPPPSRRTSGALAAGDHPGSADVLEMIADEITGVSERPPESIVCTRWLNEKLLFPAINVNDAVTKSNSTTSTAAATRVSTAS